MAEPARPGRVAGLDALRGAAVLGMVLYHLVWDLAAVGWPVPDPASSPGWSALGSAVAAAFLGVSGASLALARPRGIAFALRRLAVLAAAGLAVTAASLWFAPDAPILFGILQCIAACDALALLALPLPGWARLGLAALAVAAPSLVGRGAAVGGPLGAALGLAAAPPRTLDYRPVLPWLGAVLLGTVAGDLVATRAASRGSAPGTLARVGRHSLIVYLLHQPALYGAVWLAHGLAGSPAGPDPYTRQCRADCAASGSSPGLCAAACACAAERLFAEAGRGGRLSPEHLDALSAACRGAARDRVIP